MNPLRMKTADVLLGGLLLLGGIIWWNWPQLQTPIETWLVIDLKPYLQVEMTTCQVKVNEMRAETIDAFTEPDGSWYQCRT